jgi:hypothetical protein
MRTLDDVLKQILKNKDHIFHAAQFVRDSSFYAFDCSNYRIQDGVNEIIKHEALISILLTSLDEKTLVSTILNNSKLCSYIITNVDGCYLKKLKPEYVKLMIKNKHKNTQVSLDCLMCSIEDFDDIADEDLVELYENGNIEHNTKIDVHIEIFGDVVKTLFTKAADISDWETLGMSHDLRIKMLCEVKGTVPAVRFGNISAWTLDNMLTLCKNDPRYLPHIEHFVANNRGIANKVWEGEPGKGPYPELYRYLFVIAQCCANKAIPSYQQARLKDYSTMLKIVGWNFSAICPMVVNVLSTTGSVLIEPAPVMTDKKTKDLAKLKELLASYGDEAKQLLEV